MGKRRKMLQVERDACTDSTVKKKLAGFWGSAEKVRRNTVGMAEGPAGKVQWECGFQGPEHTV